MSEFRFILDGDVLNDDPEGYESFTSRLFRDESIKGLFISYPADLTFYGDGYQKIVTKFDTEGYCSEMSLVVQSECGGNFTTEWQGIIFVRSLKLNRTACEAKVSVQDNTYSARVFNNKSIKVDVRAARSKNEIAISPTTQIGIKMFNTIAGVVTYDTGAGEAGFTNLGRRSGFDVMAVFTHLVEFITDGNVSVRSDWYDNLPLTERYALVNGKELRLGNANVDHLFETDFEQLFEWLQRQYNLFLTYEEDNGEFFIRVEDQIFYTQSEPIVVFENVDHVIESIKEVLLYSSVSFGGKDQVNDQDENNGDFPIFDMLGFKREEYYIQGTCNIDNQLDLTTDFITDSNIIQDVLNNPDADFTDHDLDIFIVQYNAFDVSPFESVPFPVLQSAIPTSQVQIYNHSVLNSEVIQRYNLQGGIAKELGNANDTAKAVASTDNVWNNPAASVSQEPLGFDDDFNIGYDVNNNYGDGTAQGVPVPTLSAFYIIPTTGMYTFGLDFNLDILADAVRGITDPKLAGKGYLHITMGFRRYDSGGTLKDTQSKRITKFVTDPEGHRFDAVPSPPESGYALTDNLIWLLDPNQTPILHDYSFSFQRTFLKTVYGEATDEIVPFLEIEHEGDFGPDSEITYIKLKAGSFFEATNTVTGGGLFSPANADDYFISLFTFDHKVTRDEMISLLTNANKSIEVNGIRTYVDQVSLNHFDGDGKFQVITSNFNKQ